MKFLLITIVSFAALVCGEDILKKDKYAVKNCSGKVDCESCDIRNSKNIMRENQSEEIPWIVRIRTINDKSSETAGCGGVLINPKIVLTAAQCVINIDSKHKMIVTAGEYYTNNVPVKTTQQKRSIIEAIIHENFNPENQHNDIALLYLDSPMEITDNVKTLCLPAKPSLETLSECFAFSWQNAEKSNLLKKIKMPIVPHQKCESELKTTKLGVQFQLHKSFLCAGGEKGKDTCTQDAGLPLICPSQNEPYNYLHVGIVSWGIGCGTAIPGVYTDVGHFKEWLLRQSSARNITLN